MHKTSQTTDDVFNILNDSMQNLRQRRAERRCSDNKSKPLAIQSGRIDYEPSRKGDVFTTDEVWFCCLAFSTLSATLGFVAGVVL